MGLNRKVIDSTVVACMLLAITAITAVDSKPVVPEQELTAIETESSVAGVIGEFADIQASTEVVFGSVSREKTQTVTVAAAAVETKEEEPQLTEEEKEWSNKLMANVEDALNVRTQADENAELAGKLHRGDRAEIVEQLSGWTHIVSGNVDGYVKTEYCLTGTDALNFAKEVCGEKATVLTQGLRIRQNPSEDSEVYASASEGEKLTVKTEEPAQDGWVTVDYNGSTAYVKAEYVQTAIAYSAGITIEEEQEQIRKAEEEKAAKAAAQKKQAAVTQNASVAASVDEVTLLGAIIQCEAGSECYDGMVAVGAVVMNRVRSGAFPSSIQGVIYQSGQFTPAGSGSLANRIASGVSGTCIQAAQQALGGYDNTGGALYFRRAGAHAGTVIGNHVFY